MVRTCGYVKMVVDFINYDQGYDFFLHFEGWDSQNIKKCKKWLKLFMDWPIFLKKKTLIRLSIFLNKKKDVQEKYTQNFKTILNFQKF